MWESPPNVGSLGTPSRPLTSDLPQLLGIPSGFQGTWSLQSRPSGAPGTPSPIHALTIQDGIARPIHLPITFSCPSGHKPTLSPTPRTHLGCHLLSCYYLPFTPLTPGLHVPLYPGLKPGGLLSPHLFPAFARAPGVLKCPDPKVSSLSSPLPTSGHASAQHIVLPVLSSSGPESLLQSPLFYPLPPSLFRATGPQGAGPFGSL